MHLKALGQKNREKACLASEAGGESEETRLEMGQDLVDPLLILVFVTRL